MVSKLNVPCGAGKYMALTINGNTGNWIRHFFFFLAILSIKINEFSLAIIVEVKCDTFLPKLKKMGHRNMTLFGLKPPQRSNGIIHALNTNSSVSGACSKGNVNTWYLAWEVFENNLSFDTCEQRRWKC